MFCFDFEFNDFQEKKPISLGISSLDRKHKFYREFKYDDNYAFVEDHVKIKENFDLMWNDYI